MPATRLFDRAVIRLTPQDEGEDVAAFLQGLVTSDVAGALPVAEAVAQGAARAGKRAHAFPRATDASLAGLVDVKATPTDVVTQKQALTRGIEGMIAAPGDLDTLSAVFTFLCEVQCGKVPKVLGLVECLREWLDHRREVLVRRSKFRLGEIEQALPAAADSLAAAEAQQVVGDAAPGCEQHGSGGAQACPTCVCTVHYAPH